MRATCQEGVSGGGDAGRSRGFREAGDISQRCPFTTITTPTMDAHGCGGCGENAG
ncbi:MAG: hypothetical protein MW690_001188 [Methanophagales archaeon]|nr:hypothetical protein [Methanophagales archaeon]